MKKEKKKTESVDTTTEYNNKNEQEMIEEQIHQEVAIDYNNIPILLAEILEHQRQTNAILSQMFSK